MKNYKTQKKLYVFAFLILVFSIKLNAQNNAAAFAAADSSKFSVSIETGWQLYNSFVNVYNTDSVQLELILQHDNNINWDNEQFVGEIKYSPLLPQNGQNISFFLINDVFNLRIESNGNCYLKFISGTIPSANPVVFPVKIFYKL